MKIVGMVGEPLYVKTIHIGNWRVLVRTQETICHGILF